jgi:predicted methyltransferase
MMKLVVVLALLLTDSVSLLATPYDHKLIGRASQQQLFNIIDSIDRPPKQKLRDRYRHPFETLSFFGLQPDMTVVEIWPGGQGGYYRKILSRFLQESGTYIPITSSENFPNDVGPAAPGSADLVLVFRAHGFMIYDQPAEHYYRALFELTKPGGIFGIVDHRGDEQVPQDPKGENGYVNQSHVIELATKAGFELIVSSEINANFRDTKDHPDGLYSLPPTLRGTTFNRAAREKFLAIGESDRMTLKFRRPR